MKQENIEEMNKAQLTERISKDVQGMIQYEKDVKAKFLHHIENYKVSGAIESHLTELIKAEADAGFAREFYNTFTFEDHREIKRYEYLLGYLERCKENAVRETRLHSSTNQISNLIENIKMHHQIEFFYHNNFSDSFGTKLINMMRRLVILTNLEAQA